MRAKEFSLLFFRGSLNNLHVIRLMKLCVRAEGYSYTPTEGGKGKIYISFTVVCAAWLDAEWQADEQVGES